MENGGIGDRSDSKDLKQLGTGCFGTTNKGWAIYQRPAPNLLAEFE